MFIAVAALALTICFQEPSHDDLIRTAGDCCKSSDWAGAVRAFQALVDRGEADEGVLRGLSGVLTISRRPSEGYNVAKDCYGRYHTDGSLAQLLNACVGAGRYIEARQIMRYFDRNPGAWGGDRIMISYCRGVLITREWHLHWSIRKDFTARGHLLVPIPQRDPNIQVKVTYSVQGVKSWSEKADSFGTKYIDADTIPGQEMTVDATVVIKPQAWRERLPSNPGWTVPEEIKPFLAKSEGHVREAVLDPEGPLAVELARKLRTNNVYETIENVMNWCHDNLKYGSGKSSDSEYVLKEKVGACTQMTHGAVALFRACGIPARLLRGHGRMSKEFETPTPHSIPQIWIKGLGWIDWDFGEQAFVSRSNFLRMYACAPADPKTSLCDMWDPSDECHIKVVREWVDY